MRDCKAGRSLQAAREYISWCLSRTARCPMIRHIDIAKSWQPGSPQPSRVNTQRQPPLRTRRPPVRGLLEERTSHDCVATYSPRARPGFPIAAPTTWDALEKTAKPDAFTLARPFGESHHGPVRPSLGISKDSAGKRVKHERERRKQWASGTQR